MKNITTELRADIYNVFVKGNADHVQMARVFFLLAIPSITPLLLFGKFPSY